MDGWCDGRDEGGRWTDGTESRGSGEGTGKGRDERRKRRDEDEDETFDNHLCATVATPIGRGNIDLA